MGGDFTPYSFAGSTPVYLYGVDNAANGRFTVKQIVLGEGQKKWKIEQDPNNDSLKLFSSIDDGETWKAKVEFL